MSEVCSQVPVEESTHFVCMKTAGFSNTVFDKCPMISTITSFERLPEFTPVSVFEDILDSPEHHDQPTTPQVNNVGGHHVPQGDTKVHLTQVNLKTHQETCNKFLKNKTPDIEKMREFVSQLMELVEQMAAQYPNYFSIKPVYVFQPELKERLTFGDLENHQEKWKVILQNSVVSEITDHMVETIQKMELVVTQIEYYEKEKNTLRENTRQREIINKQEEYLKKINL